MSADDWFALVPKVELHCHLEGAIPLPVLWELVQRHGGDRDVRSLDDLRARFRYRDFAHFIRTWVWKNRFLRDLEDFARIAEAAAQELVRQRVLYAELHYSPIDFADSGLSIASITGAVRRGLDRVPTVRVRLICDLVRNYGPERAARTLDELEEVRGLDVVAIGLGGSEAEHPPALFRDVFRTAAGRGWHRTVHAGEAAGATSVRAAIEELGAERIGHGVRAVADDAVVRLLAERRIPLEVCPTSNLRTGVVKRLSEHPITRLRDAGVPVTVSTDDPAMFGCDLAGELRLLEERLGWSRDAVRATLLASARAAFLPADARADLERALTTDPRWRG